MTSPKRNSSPPPEEDVAPIDLSDGEDIHHQQTAVGGWSQAMEEARVAAHSSQPTTKANKFDLEAAIARAKAHSMPDSGPPDRPPSGTRRRASKASIAPPLPAANEETAKTPAPAPRVAPVAAKRSLPLFELAIVVAFAVAALARCT